MGEYKLEHISDLLFEHMVVGMIFSRTQIH